MNNTGDETLVLLVGFPMTYRKVMRLLNGFFIVLAGILFLCAVLMCVDQWRASQRYQAAIRAAALLAEDIKKQSSRTPSIASISEESSSEAGGDRHLLIGSERKTVIISQSSTNSVSLKASDFPIIHFAVVSHDDRASDQLEKAVENGTADVRCHEAPGRRLVDIASCIDGQYGEFLSKAAREEGLSKKLLVALMIAASDGNATAERDGCLGLMQLCAATLHDLGIRTDQAFDPATNIAGSARLLRKHLAITGGNTEKALAYYGYGKNAVDQRVADEGMFHPSAFRYAVRVMRILDQLS